MKNRFRKLSKKDIPVPVTALPSYYVFINEKTFILCMKKSTVIFLLLKIPAFAHDSGEDEIAVKTTSALIPLFKK